MIPPSRSSLAPSVSSGTDDTGFRSSHVPRPGAAPVAVRLVKTVIVGAGAIGGYIGAHLARSGADVVLFARGAHLQAMRARGLRVSAAGGDFVVTPAVADDPVAIGPADLVLLAVKGPSVASVAPMLAPLLRPDTIVVCIQNGLPWWYFHGQRGRLGALGRELTDPRGVVASAVDPRQVLGAIVYFATEIVEPGVIRHSGGHRMFLGEPTGLRSARCRRAADLFAAAGLPCTATTAIRREIWVKLLGNVAFNPLSVVTGATVAAMVRHPDLSALVRAVMGEVRAVAWRLGIRPALSVDARITRSSASGDHKTSMLQDFEAGRPLELETIAGAVVRLAGHLGVPMPATQAVYACAKRLDECRARSER